MVSIKNATCTIDSLMKSKKIEPVSNLTEDEIKRIGILDVNYKEYFKVCERITYVGVTDEFRNVVGIFKQPGIRIPAGFRPEFVYNGDNALFVDLKRDIGYDKDGKKKPTRVLLSADSANPYEVAPMKDFIANLTCNPAIIYNLFINNPEANIGNKFKDRYEVIAELANVLGSGVDISVEVDDPFADEDRNI